MFHRPRFLVFGVKGNLFQKVGKRSASVRLLDAEQAVRFFGIGLPIVHQSAVVFFADCGQQKSA